MGAPIHPHRSPAAPRARPSLLVLALALASTAAAGPRSEPIEPVPVPEIVDPKKVELGRLLYHDLRLSADRTVSCATCHPLERGGVDGRRFSTGVGGQQGTINSPTVFNAALHFALFWDARARDVRDQIGGPITDPREMGMTWPAVVAVIGGDAEYQKRFADIYDGITEASVRDALGTFIETLLTPGAPFDRWLAGDEDALTPDQREGYRRFKSFGCVACHHGVAIGGNMIQTFGVMGDYFVDRGGVTPADLGRFNVTGREEDRHRFKVPSLRNVALTAPYFHDGSAADLAQAVRVMAYYQLGRRPTEDDVRLIVAFLESLTGTWQGEPLGRRPAKGR
ncbi:MAG: cytochrome c peroxidase [bacterium]|nr:c-type cytochrome [Myxococcales bacterium]